MNSWWHRQKFKYIQMPYTLNCTKICTVWTFATNIWPTFTYVNYKLNFLNIFILILMTSTKIFQGKSLSRLAFNGNSRRHIHLANLYWLEPCRGNNILLKKVFLRGLSWFFWNLWSIFFHLSKKLLVTEDVIFTKNTGWSKLLETFGSFALSERSI